MRTTDIGSGSGSRPWPRPQPVRSESGDGPTRGRVADEPGWLTTVARGGVATLLGAAMSAAASFGLVVVVAHGLSRTTAGLFFSATSLFLAVEALGRLGADTGLVYFVARWRAHGLNTRIRAGLRSAIAPAAATCGVLAVIGFVLAPQIAAVLGDPSEWTVHLLRVLAVVLPIAVAYDLALGASRGFGWMRPTVLIDKIGRPLAQLCLMALVITLGRTGAIGYAWALPYAGALLAMSWLLRGRLRSEAPSGIRGSPDGRHDEMRPVRREFWSFTLPRAFAGVAQVIIQRLDIVLVAVMRGPRDAAIYTAATRFLVVGQLVNQALTAPIQPQVSAAFAVHDLHRAARLYEISTAWLVLGSWPVFGTAAILAPEYVHLFGNGYADGVPVVVIISAAMLVASAVGLVDTMIIMAGRTAWNLQTTVLALVVNVGLDVVLIPRFGIVGAAVGWFASILAANLVPLWMTWRRLGLHPFGSITNLALALCAGSWLVLPLAVFLIGGGSRLGAGLGVIGGAAVFAAGLWRWRSRFHIDVLVRRRPAEGAI